MNHSASKTLALAPKVVPDSIQALREGVVREEFGSLDCPAVCAGASGDWVDSLAFFVPPPSVDCAATTGVGSDDSAAS